jgi:two-component system phosphate regulon sensor histidine kinase PhoR
VSRWRFRLLYFVLLPTIAVAAAILGYYSWLTASQFARLGEETIVQSTLLLVREKVDRVEQMIIDADNAVLGMVDLERPERIERRWPRRAPDISPSIRAVQLLDDAGNLLAYAYRGKDADKRELRKLFFERVLPDLELGHQRVGQLQHLHRSYGGESHLISYQAMRHEGRRYYAIAHHDTRYLVHEELPQLFATEEGKRLYNVVDDNNHRVFGPSLAGAGDYLVGHRFPTTLYNWRLQVAPKQAPLLDAKGRWRWLNEVALIGTSFTIVLLGMIFLLYAASKERRLNVLKSEFIANVSHELKTPLSVIRMFGELLLTRRVRNEEKKEQYLEIICRESERLSALIENVLDFSALERGKQKYEMREADLGEVVSRAIETFRYRMEREGNEVSLHVEGELPTLQLDEQAVLLALINLLDNAVKYGGSTSVEVSVAAQANEVQVRIRDHGPGIPAEDLRRVFERFYRGRRPRQARGSGIGLSIVRHIAEAHGGRAWADNAPDGGAVVGFAIPKPGAAAETAAHKPGPGEPADPAGAGAPSS